MSNASDSLRWFRDQIGNRIPIRLQHAREIAGVLLGVEQAHNEMPCMRSSGREDVVVRFEHFVTRLHAHSEAAWGLVVTHNDSPQILESE
ncbi:hypothetical protein LMG16407_03242 [Pandoraea apista]|nr:hypothetical protein AT395_00265 [Pandoraea apista]CFB63167.1 hypothetical protein LMG16407_03242 [Pandoraea apista]